MNSGEVAMVRFEMPGEAIHQKKQREPSETPMFNYTSLAHVWFIKYITTRRPRSFQSLSRLLLAVSNK